MNLERVLAWFGRRRPAVHNRDADAVPTWTADRISDEWFASHFNYAADVVHQALSPPLDPSKTSILDFGCYDGTTALGLVLRHGWKQVVGVDIDPGFDALPRLAREQIGLEALPNNLAFRQIRPQESMATVGRFGAIMCWSVFEHIERELLDPIVADLHSALSPGGYFFLQVDPLFFSPQGSHLGRFAIAPWAHLRLSARELEHQVLSAAPETVPPDEITEQFRCMSFDEYKRFIFQHYLELNRITADELVDVFVRNGFSAVWQRRRRTEDPIPEDLAGRYDEDLLRTCEIVALFRSAHRD